uniref:GLOBIN domain-containing protein n=1 Tax=Strongyloides venezuelensis TaxID=75913 RepID=A0A0K0F0D4_STRVS
MYRVMIYENNSSSFAVKRGLLIKNITTDFKMMNERKDYISSSSGKNTNNIVYNTTDIQPKIKVELTSDIETTRNITDEGTENTNACSLNACNDDKNKKIKKEVSRLTKQQQIVLQRTFASIKVKAVQNGVKLLLRMFAEHPQYKDIWPQFRPYPDSSLMCAPELSRHAKTYMKGLEFIICSLIDEEKLYDSLQRIAKAHVKWNIHKKHVMHMLEQVLIMIADEIGPLSNDEKEAWTTLYDVIANMVDIFAGRI